MLYMSYQQDFQPHSDILQQNNDEGFADAKIHLGKLLSLLADTAGLFGTQEYLVSYKVALSHQQGPRVVRSSTQQVVDILRYVLTSKLPG